MNRNRLLLLLLLSVASFPLFAQETIERYEVTLDDATEGWHSFILPSFVFSKVTPGLSDLRVIRKETDTSFVEMPYLVKILDEKEEKKKIPFQQINRTEKDGSYFITYKIPSGVQISEIDLDLENENFDWTVTLQGSQNQQTWFTIVKDYRILSLKNSAVDFEYSQISFNTVQYAFLRVQIDADEEPLLTTSSITRFKTSEGSYKNYDIYKPTVNGDSDKKITEIIVELKEEVPISILETSFNTKVDYYRPVSISYASDSISTDKGIKYLYRTLTTDVFNSKDEEHIITFNPIIAKRIKLSVRNYDNQPLALNQFFVSGPEYQVVTRLDNESANYFLTYGDQSFSKPNYDLVYFQENIPSDLKTLRVSKNEQIILHTSESTPFSFLNNQALLWVLILLVITILGWFSFKMMG